MLCTVALRFLSCCDLLTVSGALILGTFGLGGRAQLGNLIWGLWASGPSGFHFTYVHPGMVRLFSNFTIRSL
jgi:hypothetical protein